MKKCLIKRCVFCGREFEAYSDRQEQCGRPECELKMIKRSRYKRKQYHLDQDAIQRVIADKHNAIITQKDLIPIN